MFLQKNRRRKKLPVEKNRSTFLYDRRLSLRKSSTGRFFDYFSLRALRAPLSPLLTAPMWTKVMGLGPASIRGGWGAWLDPSHTQPPHPQKEGSATKIPTPLPKFVHTPLSDCKGVVLGWGVFGAIFPTHPPPKKGVLAEKSLPTYPRESGGKNQAPHPPPYRCGALPAGLQSRQK